MFDHHAYDSDSFDYELMEREERPFARRLAIWIGAKLVGPVLDVGAGTGVYVDELRSMGVKSQGIDICEPQPRPEHVITLNLFECELTAPVVMCIEVAEHIAAEQAPALIDKIWSMTDPGGWVVWSAAQPGQGGVGHINCQLPEYWTGLAQACGFVRDYNQEADLHKWITGGYHMGWFAYNRQLWRRPR